MKPYLYILAVLLVGGGIGFYLGQRTAGPSWQPPTAVRTGSSDDQKEIQAILDRQKEAYRLHDALLLLRDCTSSYVEVNSTTGESESLSKALTRYHEAFSHGKSVSFTLRDQEIRVTKNSAVVRAVYSKTSDQFEQQGLRGFSGEGLWLLARTGNRWQIVAFTWSEEERQ